ncbi:MAG TPA: acyltransferase family protein [Actinotalea sp.]|nr:acyltransferase family protein [Actinotalea sp.]
MGTPRVDAAALVAGFASRDRVLDAVKAAALLVVVLAHGLAWDVSTGTPTSVLDQRPDVAWVTWTLQVLPLFFAAGAVANLGSLRRDPDVGAFLRRRVVRLATPALVYTAVWTAVLLPIALVAPQAEQAGRFLAQLLWFLGVYAAVVVAVPWTARWAERPWLTLGVWFSAVVVVDVLRWQVSPTIGWVNLLLVWGLCHQLGYHLPALRAARRSLLLVGAVAAAGTAVALGVLGPYSSSLVSYAGDPEPSNLSPPTVVVALYGAALVLLLAALWPWLARLLAADRVYLVIGAFGARGVGVYLWHIPLVALVAGAAWGLGFDAEPLSAAWWGAHLLGLAVILPSAWLLAGVAGRADERARTAAARSGRRTAAAVLPAVAVPVALLSICTTGFGTWWGPGMLGLPSSSVLNLALLGLAWFALAAGARPGRP